MHALAILGIVAALIILGLILWRNTCPLKHVINPTHRAGGYATPHALLLAIAVLAAFVLGVGATVAYNSGYFQSHYSADLHVPTISRAVPDVSPPTTLSANSIVLRQYPNAGNQSTVGACAAWIAGWILSYEWRIQHPNSHIRFSPRWMYDYYQQIYGHGRDGSWPSLDTEVVGTLGIPLFRQYPYPPYRVAKKLPTRPKLLQEAARYRMRVTWTQISGNATGGGQGLIDGVKTAIDLGHPAAIAFPVYPEYDAANSNHCMVSTPTKAEVKAGPRGGHENGVLAYDNTKRFPDGSVGGFLWQNQWLHYCVNDRVWVSYRFTRRFGYGAEYMSISPISTPPTASASPPAPPPWSGMEHPVTPAPPSVGPIPQTGPMSNVRGIYATDRNLNLSPIINAAAHAYGLPPVGLASTLGAECGWATGVNGDCNRIAAWPDVSGGACQVSVQTAGGFGVGDGSDTGYNINNVFAYEDVPANCIYLAAKVMSSYIRYTGIPYTYAEVSWNCGPGYPYITNPQGQCYDNYQHYLGWYQTAFSHAYDGPAPTPRHAVFPRAKWGYHVSPYYRRHLSWGADYWWHHAQRIGQALNSGRYYVVRGHGFTKIRFVRGCIYTFPSYHRAKSGRC